MPKRESINARLSNVYFTPKAIGSYGGADRLLKQARKLQPRISDFNTLKWLGSKDTYTLHKSNRSNFKRRKTYVSGPNNTWQIDLSDLPHLAKHNNGYRYILFCVDVFSRLSSAIPMKTKSGLEVVDALKHSIKWFGQKPLHLQSDKGREFINAHVQKYLKDNSIEHYTTENDDIKASIVERLQRTIKARMFRYFTHNNTRRYIDVLDDIMFSYNNTYHHTIKMAPSQVNRHNQESVWHTIYSPDTPYYNKPSKLRVGDHVRISTKKKTFQKGYLPNWSEEIFVILQKYSTDPTVYTLQDASGEQLAGTFYENELQKVEKLDNIYRIEEILGTRKIRGRTQYLVKWLGYPSSMNSYVDKDSVVLNYKN